MCLKFINLAWEYWALRFQRKGRAADLQLLNAVGKLTLHARANQMVLVLSHEASRYIKAMIALSMRTLNTFAALCRSWQVTAVGMHWRLLSPTKYWLLCPILRSRR